MTEKYQWNKVYTVIKEYEHGVLRSVLSPVLKAEPNDEELERTIQMLKRQGRIKEYIGKDEKGMMGNLLVAVDNLPKDLTKRERVSEKDQTIKK